MPTVRILLHSFTAAHLACIEAIRAYITKHDLDWDFEALSTAQLDQAPDDAWWIAGSAYLRLTHLTQFAPGRTFDLISQPHVEGQVCCIFDEHAFGQIAVTHFLSQGFHHIGAVETFHANGAQRHAAYYSGLAESCRAQGLDYHRFAHQDPNKIDTLIHAISEGPLPLALYASTDGHAAWLQRILLQAGLRIPDDVAILGTGDTPHKCLTRDPTLSSIVIPWTLIGESAAKHIHHAIQGGAILKPTMIRPFLVNTRASTAQRQVHDPLVRQALDWLTKNLQSERPLKEAADSCKCPVRTLSAHFKAELGVGPKQMHDRLRCQRACELLRSKHMKIRDIAEQCGFSSSTALGVAFKRRFACTPREWQAKMAD